MGVSVVREIFQNMSILAAGNGAALAVPLPDTDDGLAANLVVQAVLGNAVKIGSGVWGLPRHMPLL
jgi:hypothetical protein